MMAFADLRSELTCSVCREIYTDPVTLLCGHNFCRACIDRTWDWQSGIEEDPSCPECRHRYRRRPELNRNRRLQSITEQFRPTRSEQVGAGIFCTYCDSSVPAAKSCLLCEASLCAYHLLKHSKSDKHILIDPVKPQERGKCFIHGRNLEFNCTEDGARICASCWLAGEHRGHKVELLSEMKRRQQSLKKRRREVAEKAADETERVTALFRDIREQLEALEKRLLIKISRYNENISLKRCDPMQQPKVWDPFLGIYPYFMAHSQRTEREDQNVPDRWTLISQKFLTGLDEIVADVKEKIHGHQVRPQVHDVVGKNVPEHSLKAVGFPSVKAAKRGSWHREWPLKRTTPSDQETEGRASASATPEPFSLVSREMPHQLGVASQWSGSFPMETTITEVPLPVQPQVNVPGEKVHEHSNRGFSSFALTPLPMEELRSSTFSQDYVGKEAEVMGQRERLHSLFSKMKEPSDHKTEGQTSASPTVECVTVQSVFPKSFTPLFNSLEGATKKRLLIPSFAKEETTKAEDTLFNINTSNMDLSTLSSSSSSSSSFGLQNFLLDFESLFG